MLESLGFEEVRVTRRFDTFDGTSRESTARRFGVIGINLFARAPERAEVEMSSNGWFDRLRRVISWMGGAKPEVTVDASAPGFELPLSSGTGRYNLHAQRGQYVLLMFLPSQWCPVCQACLRVYKDSAATLRRNGVQLAIVTTELTDAVNAFACGTKLDHVILIDADGEVARRFGATQQAAKTGSRSLLPISFFVDREGLVRRRSELDAASLCLEDIDALFED